VLDGFAFPGNVRELENMMERAVALASTELIGVEDLPVEVTGLTWLGRRSPSDLPESGCNLDGVLEQTERSLIEQALKRSKGVRTSAAKLLGVSFRSLRYRLTKLGMDGGDAQPGEEQAGDEQEGEG
jgi:two-component system response regulator PilR (NtrC family)